MNTMASQITCVSIVCSTVSSGADQRKHQNSASLACVRGIHQWPVDSPQRPVTQKMFPFDDVIIACDMSSNISILVKACDYNSTMVMKNRGASLWYYELIWPSDAIYATHIDLGQHCFSQWFVVWRRQALTWITIDEILMRSCGIHLKAIPQ